MTSTFLDTFLTKDNATPDYERFYYTKRYIASKRANFTSREAREELGRVLGYKVEKPTFVAKLADRRRRYDMIRYHPAFYGRVTFQEGTPESEAIAIRTDLFVQTLPRGMGRVRIG
jgi:hypothetical protein